MLEKGNRANTLHGILLIALFSFAAFYIAEVPVVKRLSFSPLIVGIVLGMLYANSLRNKLPETWVPGIKLCTKQVLRWGIILYGFRLTLAQVAAVGIPAVAVDLIVVTVTLLGGVLLGRLLKIDRDTALMTSTGSAICGAAAVLGAEPVVKCEGYKTAIAVSTVVIFGTLSMFLYPVMYRTGMLDGLTDTGVAIYTGSTLHEVAHVAGAGNAMDPSDMLGIAGTATITKMIRVMMLAPVLIIMGFVLAGRRKKDGGKKEKSKITMPWFAFGFIGVICLNSLLQYLFGVETIREIPLNGTIEYVDTFMLTMAMTALGTETNLAKFKQAGAKPFVLAGLLYVWLLVGGYYVTKYLVGVL
ncbi:YeiH family protein [Alistipes sp.]|uniref:YeiH family protein n=1 Tax=Alistipes sp. TaxID=1872444 RepID=UPI003AB25F5B